MFAHKPLTIALVLMLTVGCAYSAAMSKGTRLEGSGDWEGAYAAYAEALGKKPDDLEASAGRDRAAAALVDEQLRQCQDHLAIGDYEKVLEKLAYINQYDPDRPEVFEIQAKAQDDMAKKYKRAWEAGSVKTAYEMAIRTRKLFPTSEHLEEAFDNLRGHYTDAAKEELDKKQFQKALDTLHTVTEFEPDRQGDIAALEQTILQKWGDHLADEADRNAKAKKLGAAAVLYARAYEVAGRREDLDKSRRIAKELEPEGKLTVSLKMKGVADRGATVKNGVLSGLGNITDTQVVPTRGALDIVIDVAKQNCSEKDEVTPTKKDFIAGQVEEPNPEWHELTKNLETQRAKEAEAKKKAEILWPDVEAAQETLKGIDAEMDAAKRELTDAQAKVTEAQTQLDKSKARRDELQAQLQQHEAVGATATAEQVRKQLGEMGQIISEWSGEVIKRQDGVSAAERKVKGLEVDRGPANESFERLKAGYDAIMKDKNGAQDSATELASKLGSTPKTVWKDVHETLEYEIHDWTRTCIAPVAVYMAPNWETTKPTKEDYNPLNETKDRSHIGHEKADVKEDPKVYPESDADLVAKSDTATIAEIVGWLDTMTKDHFQVRRTNTAVALVEKPVDATTELVRLYVGAQGRLDEPSVKMFQAHVKQHFGLEKIELIRPTDSPTN